MLVVTLMLLVLVVTIGGTIVLTHCMDVVAVVDVEFTTTREGAEEQLELTCRIACKLCVRCTEVATTELNKLPACVGAVFVRRPAIEDFAEFVPDNIAFSIAFDVIEIPEFVGGLGVITDDVCRDRLLLACDCTPLEVTRKNDSEV